MGFLRLILLVLIAKPLARILTGADVEGRERLPVKGPAIVVANHNSHVDTFLLLTIFPARYRLGLPADSSATARMSSSLQPNSLPIFT